jgi:hypothetical protein
MKQKNKTIWSGITQKKSDQIMVEEKFVNDIIFEIHIWSFVVS